MQSMRTVAWIARGSLVGALLMSSTVAWSQGPTKEQTALATALRTKHIALAAGLEAASTSGKPISAKYEYEDGKLLLSVYTEKGGQFSEVIVDHVTGKVAKTDKITEGEDFKSAQAQSAATAKGKSSLAAALEKALAANPGYSAVSATATLKGAQPVAEIALMKGTEFKTVTQPLG
jgi:hypothetical protein